MRPAPSRVAGGRRWTNKQATSRYDPVRRTTSTTSAAKAMAKNYLRGGTKARAPSSRGEPERRNSFEIERSASGFDKAAAMAKAFSTGNLTGMLQPEPEISEASSCFYHKESCEHRIRIDFEGDGPLGIGFAEDGDEIVVQSIQEGTACSEFPELTTKLLLREIDGSAAAVRHSFQSAMRAIASSWRRDNAVSVVFARPKLWVLDPPKTASGPPSLAGMVMLKDDGVGHLDYMSPIHEAHRKGSTPRLDPSAQPRALPLPPELSLASLQEVEEAAETAVETERDRQLQEVQKFLCDLKVERFLSVFVDFGVSNMDDLKFIEPADLEDFGLKPLEQRRVATAVAKLQDADNAYADASATDVDSPRMARSPSQVFELNAFDPPELLLDHGSSSDVHVFISPFLPEEQAVRFRHEASQQLGKQTSVDDSDAWAQSFDV